MAPIVPNMSCPKITTHPGPCCCCCASPCGPVLPKTFLLCGTLDCCPQMLQELLAKEEVLQLLFAKSFPAMTTDEGSDVGPLGAAQDAKEPQVCVCASDFCVFWEWNSVLTWWNKVWDAGCLGWIGLLAMCLPDWSTTCRHHPVS